MCGLPPDGKEAEELRAGIERIIAFGHEDACDIRQALRNLLDRVDARDSLAYLEAQDDGPEASEAVVEAQLDHMDREIEKLAPQPKRRCPHCHSYNTVHQHCRSCNQDFGCCHYHSTGGNPGLSCNIDQAQPPPYNKRTT